MLDKTSGDYTSHFVLLLIHPKVQTGVIFLLDFSVNDIKYLYSIIYGTVLHILCFDTFSNLGTAYDTILEQF